MDGNDKEVLFKFLNLLKLSKKDITIFMDLDITKVERMLTLQL